MTDFKNYPVSLAEARAEREWDSKKWAPRDALVQLLREIDTGKVSVGAIVIAYLRNDNEILKPSYSIAGADAISGLGILARCAHMMNEATGEPT